MGDRWSGKCGDCKFWGKEKRTVVKPDFAYPVAQCTRIGQIGDHDSNQSAAVEGGDGYFGATLWTQATFGCLLFEPKPCPACHPNPEPADGRLCSTHEYLGASEDLGQPPWEDWIPRNPDGSMKVSAFTAAMEAKGLIPPRKEGDQ